MEIHWKEQTWWDKRAQTGVVGLQSESVALLYLHSPPQSSKGNNLSRKQRNEE
jgi:hypothetical protein